MWTASCGDPTCGFLMLIDVRRALLDSAARRKVSVELAAEACTDKGEVGRLLRSMYG